MQNRVIRNIFDRYEKWVLKPLQSDVRKSTVRNQFIPFIVFSVIIDNLASIRYLGEIPATRRNPNVGRRYRKFIDEYMPPEYGKHRKALYKNFRNKLVHMFQIEDFDLQQSRKSRKLHLTKLPSGKICLNSEEFLKDLYAAFRKVRSDMVGPRAKRGIVVSFSTSYKEWSHEEYSA